MNAHHRARFPSRTHVLQHVLWFGIGVTALAACGGDLDDDCSAFGHCHFEGDSATCDDGYEWQDADDPNNYSCTRTAGNSQCTLATYYEDLDQDGYGNSGESMDACTAPAGYAAGGDDCDDTNAAVHPGAAEICDGYDNDCNGLADEDDANVDRSTLATYYRDYDGDGVGNSDRTMTECSVPTGYVNQGGDCDDYDRNTYPGAPETCDGEDNDCDGAADIDDPDVDLSEADDYYLDADGDGYGSGASTTACAPPVGYVLLAGDCNDTSDSAHPGATEVCDGQDNNCDGFSDSSGSVVGVCDSVEGSYGGSYSIGAAERLGSTTINQVSCDGTVDFVVDLAQTPSLQGTASCRHSGGSGLFDSVQNATIEAGVGIDGTVSGTLVHTFNDYSTRTYAFTGSLDSAGLSVTGTGSVWPHPQSAVAWEVEYLLTGL